MVLHKGIHVEIASALETDVLVIGAGGAGVCRARGCTRRRDVILADRSLIGRGGATVMAQMTVAVALGEQTPDHWEHHLSDTLAAGVAFATRKLAAILCEDGPRRIREMDGWKVGWAREDGHIKQVQAPVMTGRAAFMWISCRPTRYQKPSAAG